MRWARTGRSRSFRRASAPRSSSRRFTARHAGSAAALGNLRLGLAARVAGVSLLAPIAAFRPVTAGHPVGAFAAEEAVVALLAEEAVVGLVAEDRVVSEPAGDDVLADVAEELVVAVAAHDCVVLRPAVHQLRGDVGSPGDHEVVLYASQDDVRAAALDDVLAVPAEIGRASCRERV